MLYRIHEKQPVVHENAYIAPGAILIGDVIISDQASVWFNAVLRGDNSQITVGERSNIQDGAIIHVDPGFPAMIGQDVTIGHNAIIHGCIIEDGALIGMGAAILNGAIVKKGALVAAGALVTEGMVIEEGMLAAGVPAKLMKNLTESQVERLKRGAESYVQKGSMYSRNLELAEKG
ncbi:MAG TPA: gamma carbonic anhydrase family protein [Bacillus sp. (in: firmicutes)]|uniref:gamma carbonic anhydrase family protein n=1 Tax=Bacillus litorisediminis TaxID=2922713 RepID=UPI001FAE1EE3|nr:gamma carbonic anhydrase family protein [Bacillus litorisediminis]HWO76529.1 gamma carbonic anhydrase family protein [Bacillus sp. (in: firmicutes)]